MIGSYFDALTTVIIDNALFIHLFYEMVKPDRFSARDAATLYLGLLITYASMKCLDY